MIETEIKWKDEKDLTKEFKIKKQQNKSECCHFLYFNCCFLMLDFIRYKSYTSHAESTPNRILFQLFLTFCCPK